MKESALHESPIPINHERRHAVAATASSSDERVCGAFRLGRVSDDCAAAVSVVGTTQQEVAGYVNRKPCAARPAAERC